MMGTDDQNLDFEPVAKSGNVIVKTLTLVPDLIETIVCRLDMIFGGIKTITRFHDRSLLAFYLPLIVCLFIVWGPSLARNFNGALAWRGGFLAVLLLAGVVVLQTIYFLQNRWRGMAWVHLGLLTTLFLLTWFLGKGLKQSSGSLYPHYYGLLALIAMLVAVPLAWWLKRRALFALSTEVIDPFRKTFNADRVVAQDKPKRFNTWDFLGAMVVAVLRTPLHVVTPVAFVLLAVSAEHLICWAIFATALSLIVFTMSNYDPERDAFVRLVRHTFLSGGTLLVTLAVVTLAVLRLAGVDYVTTVLDGGSRWTLFSYIVSTYALFWLYDFWFDQAILDLLGDLNGFGTGSGQVSRHGSGRLAVTTSDGVRKRMFEPVAFLMRIAQTVPKLEKRTKLQEKAAQAEQRFQAFRYACLLLFAAAIFGLGWGLHRLDQAPGLEADAATVQTTDKGFFNLPAHLMSTGEGPVVMLAASGGGTRAALYTTAVLHGLARLDKLKRLVLVSGVSGGSAALAYFATRMPVLLRGNDTDWRQMRETLSAPFIDDVLAGAAEWRIVSRSRLGQLLTESFKRRFLPTGNHKEGVTHTTLGAVKDLGLIFNTALCGSGSSGHPESAADAGGRLVITNLLSSFDKKPIPAGNGWELDLPFKVVNDPKVSLFAAASLSANFPPVFSNAAVVVGDKRFWVTDGGAVENRGLISILLALIEALETIQRDTMNSAKKPELADIRIVVADASAFQPDYKSDRGMGAKFGASEKLANRLIKELLARAEKLYQSITEKKNGIQVVNLRMPDSMRASGTFGTHWMMPATVTFKDPQESKGKKGGIKLKREEAIEIIDAIFSQEYSKNYIRKKWPKLDAEALMKETKEPWADLEAGLK